MTLSARIITLFAAVFFTLQLRAQNPERTHLITGPVIGAVTSTTAKLWIAYKGNGLNLVSLMDTATQQIYTPTGLHRLNDRKGNTALTMDFTGLQPEHIYKPVYALEIVNPHPRCLVRTLSDSTVKDFDFVAGSCSLLNTGFTRIVFPGLAVGIFNTMRREKADFMLWLGDNVYYFSKHYNSFQGMFTRNLRIRNEFVTLSDFLAAQPNYAIWDDHDYGWNDADKKFPLKDTALAVFKGFWPNNYGETDTVRGNYFSYKYYDTEFFMTDDRYNRDPEGDTTGAFLGRQQLEWLKVKLQQSTASFKFICIGSQVLNDCYYGESYAKYPVERNELLDFIALNKIPGVIFITGDKHYAEMSVREWKGYTFYDFTTSPMTSPIVPVKHLNGYRNTYCLPTMGYFKKNYGKISVSGPAGSRVCKMELRGLGGQKKWEYIVKQ